MTPLIPIAGAVVFLFLVLGGKKKQSFREGRLDGVPTRELSPEEIETQAAALPWGTDYDSYREKAFQATNRTNVLYGSIFKRFDEKTFGQQNQSDPELQKFFRDTYVSQKAAWAKRALPVAAQLTSDGGDYGEPGPNGPIFAELYKQPFVAVLVPRLTVAIGTPDLSFNGTNWTINGWEWKQLNYYGMNPATTAGGGIDVLTLISTVGNYTLPMIPGFGTAANAALQATVALGQGKSLDEAALAGIRGTLPPWGQVAFDLGVGIVLQKKNPKDAAVEAALNQLEAKYPGAKAAYEKGRQAMQDLGPSLPSSGAPNRNQDQLDRIFGGRR